MKRMAGTSLSAYNLHMDKWLPLDGWLVVVLHVNCQPAWWIATDRSIDLQQTDRQREILIRIDILSKARVEKGKGELQESVDEGEYIYWNRLQIIMSIFVELCVNNNKG